MKSKTSVVETNHAHQYSKIMGQDEYCTGCARYRVQIETTNIKCPHQFFKIADETKKEGEQIQITVRWGVKIMCALCGQRRILWTDGEVEVLK